MLTPQQRKRVYLDRVTADLVLDLEQLLRRVVDIQVIDAQPKAILVEYHEQRLMIGVQACQ